MEIYQLIVQICKICLMTALNEISPIIYGTFLLLSRHILMKLNDDELNCSSKLNFRKLPRTQINISVAPYKQF